MYYVFGTAHVPVLMYPRHWLQVPKTEEHDKPHHDVEIE